MVSEAVQQNFDLRLPTGCWAVRGGQKPLGRNELSFEPPPPPSSSGCRCLALPLMCQEGCCDTGEVYDPGASQCCTISGVQSLNSPCPCETDLDCAGGGTESLTTSSGGMVCCTQTSPQLNAAYYSTVRLQSTNALASRCNIYAHYPTGTGTANAAICLGTCIDTQYRACCNGVACNREYEQCCNNTCSNIFTDECTVAIQSATDGSPNNYREYLVCPQPLAL